MKKADLHLYTDYLLSTFVSATATGLSEMVDCDVIHDQVARFLSAQKPIQMVIVDQSKKAA